jgi:predicted DNA-binding protein with PD1-like motif
MPTSLIAQRRRILQRNHNDVSTLRIRRFDVTEVTEHEVRVAVRVVTCVANHFWSWVFCLPVTKITRSGLANLASYVWDIRGGVAFVWQGPDSGAGEKMRFTLLEDRPKTYALVFSTGEELAAGLGRFAAEQKLAGSSFKAIGALASIKLAWFDWQTRKYLPSVVLEEQVELVSLMGDIALDDGKPHVHAHAVVAKADGSAHGGHLIEAYVRPTCEVVLTESPKHLQKQFDPESGLALIRP